MVRCPAICCSPLRKLTFISLFTVPFASIPNVPPTAIAVIPIVADPSQLTAADTKGKPSPTFTQSIPTQPCKELQGRW